MKSHISAQKFLASAEAEVVRQDLIEMTKSPLYNTKSSYTTTSVEDMTFVDKHMRYLSKYVNIDPQQYVANLRLMTRI